MKKILLIHGPILNMIAKRDTKHYGVYTLPELVLAVKEEAKKHGCIVAAFQSNHEGRLIDIIQKYAGTAQGIIINPGALTHYSYALHDALVDAGLPTVEVHLSNVNEREPWRKISVTAPACKKVISGKKIHGYLEAVNYLAPSLS